MAEVSGTKLRESTPLDAAIIGIDTDAKFWQDQKGDPFNCYHSSV